MNFGERKVAKSQPLRRFLVDNTNSFGEKETEIERVSREDCGVNHMKNR